MNIKRPDLKELVVQIAIVKYAGVVFKRRPLMQAVEKRIRDEGMWEESDDIISGSRGIKSRGLANIDWAITQLGDERKLVSIGFNQWTVKKAN